MQPSTSDWKNKLFFGDNLEILREHVEDESVDLIYLDPPFNSNATYNVLFKERSGAQSGAQIAAFDDTWHWGLESQSTYFDMVTKGGKIGELLQALYTFLGQNDMMAYLVMMAPRLVDLHRVLKPTGSIYLHCDPTASHYLKLIMDSIFGPENFRSEITWRRTNIHNDSKGWSAVADIILYYVRNAGERFTWNPIYLEHTEHYLNSKYRHDDGDGRKYRLSDMRSPNPRHNLIYEWKGHKPHPNGWAYSMETMEKLDREGRIWYPDAKSKRPQLKRYLENTKGTLATNIWTDINPINSMAVERLGYPTQKPEALLERILAASSNEGDIVLDPFCGCGTAVHAAEKLHRRWIGIDITHLAITLIKNRLRTAFGAELSLYEVVGDPKDLESARALGELDRYQFEWWAIGLVDARPAQDKKKGADKGIDGYITFFDDGSNIAKRAVVQVKSGHVNRSQIGDLNNARQREKAEIAVFITLEVPTDPMMKEAVATGFYQPEYFPGMKVPRMQILTIGELLGGKKVKVPIASQAQLSTFKAAGKAQKSGGPQQVSMFDHQM